MFQSYYLLNSMLKNISFNTIYIRIFFFIFKIFNRTLVYFKSFCILLLAILIVMEKSLYTIYPILSTTRLAIKFNVNPGSNNIRYTLTKSANLYNIIKPYI